MVRTSIIGKIKNLINFTISSPLFIVIALLFIGIIVYLIKSNKTNKRRNIIIFATSYIVLISSIIYVYKDTLLYLVDYLIDNLFLNLLFPNLAVYTAMLIILNVFMVKFMFQKEESKVRKVVSIIAYFMFHFVLILILDVILHNNIDIYSETSIYNNQSLFNLIEISITIFITWMVIILIDVMFKRALKNFAFVPKTVLNPISITEENRNALVLFASDVYENVPSKKEVVQKEVNIYANNIKEMMNDASVLTSVNIGSYTNVTINNDSKKLSMHDLLKDNRKTNTATLSVKKDIKNLSLEECIRLKNELLLKKQNV